MATTRTKQAVDPAWSGALTLHESSWVPVFLARAAHGLGSVLAVSATSDGLGSVAVLSPVEASALLRKRDDTKGSAKVAGTPSPGTVWTVGFAGDTHAVWSLALMPILTRGGAPKAT